MLPAFQCDAEERSSSVEMVQISYVSRLNASPGLGLGARHLQRPLLPQHPRRVPSVLVVVDAVSGDDVAGLRLGQVGRVDHLQPGARRGRRSHQEEV